MTVLGSAEVELTLDPGQAGQSAERELTSSLEAAGRKAGARLESALGDAGKRAGKAAGNDLSAGVESGAGDAGKRAGAKIEQGLTAAGKTAGTKAGKAAGAGVEDGVEESSRGIGVAGVAIGSALGAGIVGAAGAALGSLGDLIGGALEAADLPGQLRAKLGTGAAESAALGKTAGAIYASNYGESLGEVSDALVLIRRNSALMAGGAESDLQGVTSAALVTAETIGGDLNQVIETAGKLVSNGLAPNAKAAFDLLVTGAQRGDDSAGDLLDTFSEYAPQFAKLGVQGPQALGLLDQAIKAGARNTDIAADAIKEFSIRAVDGSTLTAAGFRGLGLDAGVMAQQIAAGGKSANDALDITLDRLRAIPDPVTRSQVAVALFGTQAEDLGTALFALDPSTAVAGLGNLSGAADRAGEALASGPQAKLDAFTRSLQGKVTTVLGNFVGYLSGLPGPAQAVAGGLGSAAAAAVAVTGAIGVLGPKLAAGKAQLEGMGKAGNFVATTGPKIAKGLAIGGAVVGGLLAAAAAIRAIQDAGRDAPAGVEEIKKALSGIGDASVGQTIRTAGDDLQYLGAQVQRIADPSLGDKVGKVFQGFGVEPVKLKDAKESIGGIDQALTSLVQSGNTEGAARAFETFAAAAEKGGASQDQLLRVLPGYRDALAGVANQANTSAGAQDKQGKAIAGATGDMSEQLSTAEKLTRTLDDLSGAAIDNTRADIAVRDSKDALSKSLKENGRSFDLATPKGRENTAALLDARDAAARYAEAQEKLNPGVGAGTRAFQGYVTQLQATLRAAGVSEAAIRAFSASILKTPLSPKVTPKVDTAPAETALQKVARERLAKVNAMPETTAAERALKQAARDRVTKINGQAVVAAAERTMNNAARARLAKLTGQAQVTAAQQQLDAVARQRTAKIDAYTGTSAAERALNYTARNRTSVITQILNTKEYNPDRRMAGGPVEAGVPYIVGEARPEVFVPNTSGRIVPSVGQYQDSLNRSAAGGGPGGAGRMHPEDIRALASAIGAAVGGGDVYLGREKVGAAVSRTIGGNLVRAGI